MANKPSRTLQVLAENLERLMAASKDFSTQPKVAAKAKVDQKTVWRIMQASPDRMAEARKKAAEPGATPKETQFHEPSLDKLDAIAKVFGVETWQLLVPGLDPAHLPRIAPAKEAVEA